MPTHQDGGISKFKLAIGAASLFLFLVGLKRTYRREDGSEVHSNGEPIAPEGAAEQAEQPEPIRFRNAS